MTTPALRQEAKDFDRIYLQRARRTKSILVGHDNRVEDYYYKNPWRYGFSRQYAFGSILRDFAHIVCGRKDLRILEIGCGNGWFSINANIGDKHFWDCIDLSHSGIAVAEKNRQKYRISRNSYVCSSLEDYAAGKKYDVIVCVNSLHHFRDLGVFFSKVRTHLKPSGVIFVHDVSSDLFTEVNAAFVLLLRMAFGRGSKVKYFEEFKSIDFVQNLADILHEWTDETDQGKQSCCDHSHSTREIKRFLNGRFHKIFYKEESGILMRFLGGLRGHSRALKAVAQELIGLEALLLKKKIIAPYVYTFVGRLK